MQAVARLEICTMLINIVLLHILLTSNIIVSSNPVTRPIISI